LSAQPELIPPQPPAQPSQSTDEDDAANHCLADLKILGAEFMPTASDRLNSRCRVVTPVDITSIKTPAGRVTFPDKPTFRCAFALQFAPGYVCRTRNGDSSTFAKMSEHATGNAVDIMGLCHVRGFYLSIARSAFRSNVYFSTT
jgi:hypothetical protein